MQVDVLGLSNMNMKAGDEITIKIDKLQLQTNDRGATLTAKAHLVPPVEFDLEKELRKAVKEAGSIDFMKAVVGALLIVADRSQERTDALEKMETTVGDRLSEIRDILMGIADKGRN